jgi:hypothetical protein
MPCCGLFKSNEEKRLKQLKVLFNLQYTLASIEGPKREKLTLAHFKGTPKYARLITQCAEVGIANAKTQSIVSLEKFIEDRLEWLNNNTMTKDGYTALPSAAPASQSM